MVAKELQGLIDFNDDDNVIFLKKTYTDSEKEKIRSFIKDSAPPFQAREDLAAFDTHLAA